MQFDADSTLLI